MYIRIFLDMDGVLVDFISGLKALWPRRLPEWPPNDWDVHKVLGLTETEMWDKVLEKGESFWSELSPYSWSKPLVDLVSDVSDEWYISTTPQNNGACVSGKLQWLKATFGDCFEDYFLGKHKFVLADSRSVLIDDNDYNVEYFREVGGHAILFPQPWNSNRDLVDTRFVDGARLHYVESRLHSLAEEIKSHA